MKQLNSLELVCPDCKEYRVLRFSGFPIPERVECPNCGWQYSVIDLACSGDVRPIELPNPELNNLDDLINYNERRTKDT